MTTKLVFKAVVNDQSHTDVSGEYQNIGNQKHQNRLVEKSRENPKACSNTAVFIGIRQSLLMNM